MSAAAKPARKPRSTAPRRRTSGAAAKRNAKQRSSGSSIALGAVGMAGGVALLGYLLRFVSRRAEAVPDNAEHPAPDLALDQPHPAPTQRAPDAFRPDATAPVPPHEREALRPATGPEPTLVRGTAGDRAEAPGMTLSPGAG